MLELYIQVESLLALRPNLLHCYVSLHSFKTGFEVLSPQIYSSGLLRFSRSLGGGRMRSSIWRSRQSG